ncbi:MAG: endonuclease/exonuclease/phosphatase family protein, partial [Myxococcota bacterium]
LRNAARIIAQRKGPKMVLGDFNCTSWSPTFQQFLKQSRLLDSRQGWGVQPSWMLHTGLFAIPIDHVLISKEILIHQRQVGEDIGSDHRPISVKFSLRGR